MSLVSGPPFGYEYPPSIDGTRKPYTTSEQARIPNKFDIKRQIFERENSNFRSMHFFRETTKRLLSLFSDAQIIGEDMEIYSVPVWYANYERSIAKLFDDRTNLIPSMTLAIADTEQDDDRRRPNFDVEFWTIKDTKTKRFTRVASLAPKAVNISFKLKLWTRYVEDMNQLIEYVMNKFHPHLRVETDFNINACGFITAVSDNSTVSAEDKQDRLIRKSITFNLETYLPSRKYMIQSNGAIKEMNFVADILDKDGNTEATEILTEYPLSGV
jgi:hypothetical protein